MPYTEDQIAQLAAEYISALKGLEDLALNCIRHGQRIDNPYVQEHMLHGAGRRISILRRAILNIYSDFPPETKQKISKDALSNVQLNLQAFVINLYGVFDNFAWAYVLRHGLEADVGSHNRIGAFSTQTQRFLPNPIRTYLEMPETTNWFGHYLKEYRDSLAHRIPLYIPPFIVTNEESERFNSLEAEKFSCIEAENWNRLNEIYAEQEAIGSPCFTFIQAFSGPVPPKPVLLHSQILSDSNIVIEFGALFLEHWHERI
jgi:hypothetical protein